MSEETTIVRQAIRIDNYDDLQKFGEMFVASGLFPNVKKASQAMVKIMAGLEMGIGAFAAMNGMHIVQGKCEPGANLMAAAIKANPRYDYKVIYLNDTGCELAFYEYGEESGRVVFDAEHANAAGLLNRDNYKKHPRNMYFARAISNGTKWYCPDAFPGPVYAHGEIVGQDQVDNFTIVDDTGEVIEVEAETVPHWIDRPDVRAAFWTYTRDELKLDENEVYCALAIECVHDFRGTMAKAKELLEAYAAQQNAPGTLDVALGDEWQPLLTALANSGLDAGAETVAVMLADNSVTLTSDMEVHEQVATVREYVAALREESTNVEE